MNKAYSLVIACYLLALAAAWLVLPFTVDYPVLLRIFIADVAATIVVFAFSAVYRNSSFYDPYWSVVPVVFAGYFLWLADELNFRQLLVGLVIVIWGLRLTGNWLYTWRGLAHEDWRYVMLRDKSGIFWWPLSFVGVHLIPTVVVFLGCIPLYVAMVTGQQALGLLDGLALAVGLGSVWLEYQSDVELHRFRRHRTTSTEVLREGLWRFCRHPNYLGELGIWLSVFLFGYAAAGGTDAWMLSGPVVMLILFAFVSIPMIENKLLEDKPDYAAWKQRSFALLPLSFLRR